MTAPLKPPPRRNPLRPSRVPLLPATARSRTAHGLTAAAAEGRFMLQVCAGCGTTLYPPRDACPRCWSADLPYRDVPPGGAVLAGTVIRTSTDTYFRERLPWRAGMVALDCGPQLLAHLHGDVAEGERVRMALRLDKGGNAVAVALPPGPTPHQEDDAQLREMAANPRFRRALVTDGRSATGQAMVRALSDAGASVVLVGIADPWKPFAGEAALRAIPGAEPVPLDVTDSRSVSELSAQVGHRVDILVNTAEHTRPGGLMGHGVEAAREAMDVRCLGLMRLAQAFGPVMRARGADGAAAWVNFLSVHALANWPAYAAYSAAEAACLSVSHALRSELGAGGVRVLNVFSGPLDTEWFQAVPPPKVAPSALAAAAVRGLRDGLEDIYVGDVAQDVRARLQANPKALERELGA